MRSLRPAVVRLILSMAGLMLLAACGTKSPTAPDDAAFAITSHPVSQRVAIGASATLAVEARGGPSLAYQWYRGGTGDTSGPVGGATAASYTTPPLSATTRYWVRVSEGQRSADSTTATIEVAPSGPSPSPPGSPSYDPRWAAFEHDVIALVNQRRATGAICGGTSFAPVEPLYMHSQLREAARAHSLDMASRNYFSHRSQDGRTFSDRISAAGYGAFPRGENIAAGYSSPTAVVNGWMAAPEHCRAIMDRSYRATGVGYAYRAETAHGHYWTQDFGAN